MMLAYILTIFDSVTLLMYFTFGPFFFVITTPWIAFLSEYQMAVNFKTNIFTISYSIAAVTQRDDHHDISLCIDIA